MTGGQVGKKYEHLFALLHFFEENKFCVMLLKDCIPHGIQTLDDYNLHDWDSNKNCRRYVEQWLFLSSSYITVWR